MFLSVRQEPNQLPENRNISLFTALTVGAFVLLLTACIAVIVCQRRRRRKNPAARPNDGPWYKRVWFALTNGPSYSAVDDSNRTGDLAMQDTQYNGRNETPDNTAPRRTASVLSTITLPSYTQTARDEERVIGREGERGGMDSVVEFPETGQEEEERREGEMESLYQIRQARRQEVAEREARRRERQETRDRGDWARLEDLRRESRHRAAASNASLVSASQNVSAATLLAEHNNRGRERRVSSVAYAEVGHVRHDGSRVRANSNESESGGLLHNAAPMGEDLETQTTRDRNSSVSSSHLNLTISRPHTRGRSASSALSISTNASDLNQSGRERILTPGSTLPEERPNPLDQHHQHSDSQPQTAGTTSSVNYSSPSSTNNHQFTPDGSTSQSAGSDDIGEARIPPPAPVASPPPNYDQLEWGDAPAYDRGSYGHDGDNDGPSRSGTQSSVRTVRPGDSGRLPGLMVPSISVQGASELDTPANER